MAEFRRPDGPSLLISTEAGGEGRNFEFCRRLVLFDLPRDPAAVEQRIGRLDRINRTTPVEIVYFRPPSGFEREIVDLYERIGLFTSPLGGLERSLADVEAAIRKAERFAKVGQALPIEALAAEVRSAADARQQSRLPPSSPGRLHGGEGAGHPRARARRPRRAHGALRPRCRGPPRLRDAGARGEAHVVRGVRRGRARRAPARRARGRALARHVRPRRGGAEGRPRLLRLGPRARGGDFSRASGRGARARGPPPCSRRRAPPGRASSFVFRRGAGVEAVAVGLRRHAASRVGRPDPPAARRGARPPAGGLAGHPPEGRGRPRSPTGLRSSAASRAAPSRERKGRRLEAVAAFRLMR